MKKKHLLISAVILAFILSLSLGVFADDLGDLQSSQDEINQKKGETQEKLEDVQESQNATQEQLNELQSQIGVLQNDIAKLQKDLSTAQSNLDKQQQEYDAIVAKLAVSQEQMQKRVRCIYMNGDISYLDVLFSAESISDFLSNFTFFEKIAEQDSAMVSSIQENKALAETKLAELEATKNQIASLKTSKENQESQLNLQSQEKDAVLASLEEDEAYYQQELAAFQKESANIESQIQSYYAKQAAAAAAASNSDNGGETVSGDAGASPGGTGSLRWPVSGSGRISSDYGNRSRGFHTGIDIAISSGTPVLAADSGTVILVKRLTYSYGQYVVIDHGGSISTLYAHMSAIHVSQGQSVEKGQQIGAVGSTGNSTGPHLHFEVRVNGKYTNPWGYVSQP